MTVVGGCEGGSPISALLGLLIDRDLFAETAKVLETEFDFLVTAQDVSQYKSEDLERMWRKQRNERGKKKPGGIPC